MSDPKNKWTQPGAPPAPMFFGENERNLVKQVNDELAERVLGQTIAYYPISVEESNFNETYGEAVEKVSLPPVRVFAYVAVENEQTNEKYGYEYQSKLTVNFHRRRLIEDQNLFVRVGDFVQYGDTFYEIVKLYNDTRYYFGQVEHKFQVSAECVRAREGAFRVMPGIDRPTTEEEQSQDPSTPAPRPAPYPPLAASYITARAESKLPNERILTAGSGITITDGGPNNAITIASSGQNAVGPTGSIQFYDNNGTFSGSSSLLYVTASNLIRFTGSLGVEGVVNVTSLSASTFLSASNLNLLATSGTIAGSGSFLGLDANNNVILSNVNNVSTSPGGANTQLQFNNSGSFGGSASLTWNGTQLATTNISASSNVSASSFYGDGSNLTGITASAVEVADGPQYSLQFRFDSPVSGDLSGSGNFKVNSALTDLMITGNVRVQEDYEFYGDIQGAIRFPAKVDEVGGITRGQVVCVNGISGQTPTVGLAACDDASKMPAFGIAGETAANNNDIQIVTFGSIKNLNLTSLYDQTFAVGDIVYVQTGSGGNAGKLTNVAPTGSGNLLQNLGKIVRNGGGGDGQIKVGGAGRTNATPNLDKGYLFVGNDTNQSVQDNTVFISSSANKVGINTSTLTHTLTVNGDISGTVGELTELTASTIVAGTIVGGSPLDISASAINVTGGIFTGQTISSSVNLQVGTAITASNIRLTGLTSGTGNGATSYLAVNTNNDIVLTASAGGGGSSIGFTSGSTTISTVTSFLTDKLGLLNNEGSGVVSITGTIGEAEDGDYTDGLFTTFVPTTAIGVAIDKFNEVLKILAPTPAPNLRAINSLIANGTTAKLSFGSSYPVAGYTSSATAAGFAAVDRSGSYAPASSGSNLRLGVYREGQDVTGTLNSNVAESKNGSYLVYSTGAVGDGNVGTLKLEVNGNLVHSVNLASFTGTGQPNTGSATSLTSGSGFIDVSVSTASVDSNGGIWTIFQYRTGKYVVSTGSMVPGWNYMRVVHDIAGTEYDTNYVEWIRDPSGSTNDLQIGNPRIEDVTLVGSKYLSGVQYNTNATANYKIDIRNLYRNVYAASGTPISFTVTNSSTPSAQSVPDIAASENNTKVLGVTGSLDVNANVTNLISGSVTANASVTHPLKATISNTGSATTGNGFLVDNRTLASTNLSEKFHDESFRKTSGSYTSQASVGTAASVWDSENHMTGGGASGHTDGLLYFNQRLYSPVDADIPQGGDFSSLLNVSTGQPDYSGITGTRTFYRVVTNSSGVTKRDMKITSTKVNTTYNNASLGTANVHFFAKIPGSTGWMDISQDFTYGSTADGDGALIAGATNDTDSGNNIHHITFGTQSVAANETLLMRIDADATWQSYISQLDFQLGATTNTTTEAPALDDIDANNSGVSDAKLSFGASNNVSGYSSATGSSIGLSNFDSNDLYSLSGDRRGVFSAKPTLTGELNEDVPSNGNNYPANAFKDAYTGSLVLVVNGAEVHSIDLSSTLNAISNDFNSNDSGFSVSAVGFSTTTDNIPNYIQPYRTGDYQVGANDQNLGWNYARVIHRIGGSDTTTNYVEWVTDTDANALGSSSLGLSNFNHPSIYYQSGVRYFAQRPSGSYTYKASNVYRNVYQNNTAVTFPTTDRSSISNIRITGSGVATLSTAASEVSLPNLNNTTNCEQQDIQVTGTVLFDSLTSISGGFGLFTAYDVAVTSRIIHPLKSTLNTSQLTKLDFMVYSGSNGSTNANTNEYFNTETYRIVSGNYAAQSDITGTANIWNSQRSVNDVGSYPEHSDGMVTVNGYLLSPKKIGNAGDTRNTAEGGSLQAPSGSPNYSSLSKATRTHYRHFENNTVNDRSSITITLYGSGSLVKKATSLGANGNFYLEAKISGKTAWLDVGTAYTSNNPLVDGAGALDGAAPGNPAVTISGGGTSIVCNFNGESLLGTGGGTELVVFKISADEDWQGYLSRVQVAYS